jgi:predicted CoA-binding protein
MSASDGRTEEKGEALDAFLRLPTLAVIGVSADRRKFGNQVYRALVERGVTVYPVHRSLTEVEGVPCYRNVEDLRGKIEGVVTVVPPAETERLMEECAQAGAKAVWMQQGSESPAAVEAARRSGLRVVAGECLFMYLEPVGSVHGIHRWLKRLFGGYTPPSPKA